jgi:putative membrane protein
MSKKIELLFPPDAQAKIAETVSQAEVKTSGEIVPYIVESSGDYDEAVWRGAMLATALVTGILAILSAYTATWMPWGYLEFSGLSLGSGILMALCVHFIPGLKRLLAGKEHLKDRVALKAAQAFIREEVFKTRERTGVLIYISLFERQVLVIGDTGINAKVKQTDWDDVVRLIVEGIRNKRAAAGLIEGIQRCGTLLEGKGVEKRTDDTNELSNAPRLGGV